MRAFAAAQPSPYNAVNRKLVLEQRTFEMSYGFVGQDKAGKEGETDNAMALSMQPDAASRSRSQKPCGRSSVNCSTGGTAVDVPVELSRILITELGDGQIIVLAEKDGNRNFPIEIGISEALAIRRRLEGKAPHRPMTHDLLASVVQSLGATLERIVINDLRDHTFFATLEIRQDKKLIEIDSRPSDAIALGVAFNTPIFVAEHVMDEVLREPTAEERIEMLRARMEILGCKIAELSSRLGDDEFLADVPEAVVADHRRQLEEMENEYEAIHHLLKKIS